MTKVVSTYVELHIFRIVNGEMEFLLLKRSPTEKYPDIWQMVTGKIKNNEKAYEAAFRELKEETNLEAEEIFAVPVVNSVYLDETDEVCLIPVFACRVNENSVVKISKEHIEFKWVSPFEAIENLAWEGQKNSVRIIQKYWFNERERLIKIR